MGQVHGYAGREEHEREGSRVPPAAIRTDEINVVDVLEAQSAAECDRKGGARRGARLQHMWRAVLNAYSVNSCGRGVERGRHAVEARGAS